MGDHKSRCEAVPVGSDSVSDRKSQCLYCCYWPIEDFDQQRLIRLLPGNPMDTVSTDSTGVSSLASIAVLRSRVSSLVSPVQDHEGGRSATVQAVCHAVTHVFVSRVQFRPVLTPLEVISGVGSLSARR
jgi:hypothetical protein